jgi:hypothetical protein
MLLFIALSLTNKQQKQHDFDERMMSRRTQAYDAVIADMWRPRAKLIADYRKARKCYVQFHLYKTANCDPELQQVKTDLGNVEIAHTENQRLSRNCRCPSS